MGGASLLASRQRWSCNPCCKLCCGSAARRRARGQAAAHKVGAWAHRPAPAVSGSHTGVTMSLVPLAVIGFCAVVAAVGELLQVRACKVSADSAKQLQPANAARKRVFSSAAARAAGSGCRRPRCLSSMQKQPIPCSVGRSVAPMARVAPPRRRCRCRQPTPRLAARSCLQWFFVWRTPAFQALKANLAKHVQKVEEAKEVC